MKRIVFAVDLFTEATVSMEATPLRMHCILSENCGMFFNDVTVHIVTSCDTLQEERDKPWCALINIGTVQFSTYTNIIWKTFH